MSEELKSLVNQYNKLTKYVDQRNKMRDRIVFLMKEEGLTKKKFQFSGDKAIEFHKYSRKSTISAKLVKDVLTKLYGKEQMQKVMKEIESVRKTSTVETIRYVRKK